MGAQCIIIIAVKRRRDIAVIGIKNSRPIFSEYTCCAALQHTAIDE